MSGQLHPEAATVGGGAGGGAACSVGPEGPRHGRGGADGERGQN
jgi:hypothetical protein